MIPLFQPHCSFQRLIATIVEYNLKASDDNSSVIITLFLLNRTFLLLQVQHGSSGSTLQVHCGATSAPPAQRVMWTYMGRSLTSGKRGLEGRRRRGGRGLGEGGGEEGGEEGGEGGGDGRGEGGGGKG